MYVLSMNIQVKAALISALVVSLQLLAANSSLIYAQATNHRTTITSSSVSSVSSLDTGSTNETDQNLTQLRPSIARDSSKAIPLSTEFGDEINQLEWTGQYVERYVRVPEGNSGKAKLIRFLIPVYREKGTQRKMSVGTEDKRKN